MLIEADARGWGETAAEVAVLLSERGLGGTDTDLELRLRRWRGDKGKRAEAARGLARRWLGLLPPGRTGGNAAGDIGACIALAFPDRVAKRRGADGGDWISVGGRGFRLDPASPLAREDWLAVAEVGGAAAGARILSAAALGAATVESLFADRIASGTEIAFDPATGTVRASRGRRLGAILLSGGQDGSADPAAIEAALSKASARTASTSCRGAKPRDRCAAGPPSPAAAIPPSPTFPTRRCTRRSTTGCRCSSPAGAASPTSIPRAAGRSTRCSAGRAARRSTASPPAISRPRPAAATPSTMRPRPDPPSPSASRPCSASPSIPRPAAFPSSSR